MKTKLKKQEKELAQQRTELSKLNARKRSIRTLIYDNNQDVVEQEENELMILVDNVIENDNSTKDGGEQNEERIKAVLVNINRVVIELLNGKTWR